MKAKWPHRSGAMVWLGTPQPCHRRGGGGQTTLFGHTSLCTQHRLNESTSDSQMNTDDLLRGACHCGAVQILLPHRPEKATKCNCSICRRLGAIYAYFEHGTVQITGHPEHTDEYISGDRTLRNIRCKTCGCATHWEPLKVEPGTKGGINLNNFDPKLIENVRIRKFDGADTWSFLDEAAQ